MINEAWFNTGSFKTYKLPYGETYFIASFDGIIETLEGPADYKSGDYIITGQFDERYPISPNDFKLLKNDLGYGKCIPNKIIKLAKLADHDGIIYTKFGELKYTTGEDFIVKHGTNDYGVVKYYVFTATYNIDNI